MNRENLQTLATFLAYDPRGVDFDMGLFSSGSEFRENVCKTAGCALGHGTFIWPKELGESYANYGNRMFGLSSSRWGLWHWCFSVRWTDIDNTRLGAAKRIQYLLDNNGELPRRWDYNHETVALYANTEVKTDQPTEPKTSTALIAALMDKIKREPKLLATEPKAEPQTLNPALHK